MSLSTPLSVPSEPVASALAPRQEQLMFLNAGSEVRCRSGYLTLRGTAGGQLDLAGGQTFSQPVASWITVEARAASVFQVQAFEVQEAMPERTQAQKNRQGLVSLWRWCAERLSVRRGPRAA